MTSRPLRIGIIGLGRAFVLMLPTFRLDDRVQVVAAFDPRPSARDQFARDFGGRTYESARDLCADPTVEAIYIASPHQYHCEHAIEAARAAKHALVEKPMAITIDEALRMIAAFDRSDQHLIVGPCHSFDAPILKAREVIASGAIGQVRMIHALNCTDFLYRPRRPEELRTEEGGGVVFSQGVHQIDVVRLLCGEKADQVSAMTGSWDPGRLTEGAYSATLSFECGAFASLTYSGYARFDSDVWQDWIGELGQRKDPQIYGSARKALANLRSPQAEADLKATRTYGPNLSPPNPAEHHEHFGPMIVFGERGDIRITPHGVHLYTDSEAEFIPCAFEHPRADVIKALWSAIRDGAPPPQTGAWGLASLEICHAIIESSRQRQPIGLRHQIGLTS